MAVPLAPSEAQTRVRRAPELLPVLVVAARLGQVEGRQVGAHGAELGEAVFQEGVEAASAAPDLQHARRGLLPPCTTQPPLESQPTSLAQHERGA